MTVAIYTHTDVQIVAVIKASEDYENLAEGFSDVFSEINQLLENPTININGEMYTFEFYLCCDYKVCVCSYT